MPAFSVLTRGIVCGLIITQLPQGGVNGSQRIPPGWFFGLNWKESKYDGWSILQRGSKFLLMNCPPVDHFQRMDRLSNPCLSYELPTLPESGIHTSVDDLYKQGFIAEGAEQAGLAAAYFTAVHQQQPDNPYILLDLARTCFKLFEFEHGKSRLLAAAKSAGRDPEFWYQIGLIWQEFHFEDEAERCLLLARNHGSGNPVFSATLIAYYESRGMLAKATAAMERARRKGQRGALLMALEGMLLLRSGDHPAAVARLTESLSGLHQEHPYQVVARYALARALAEGREENASIERLREAKDLQKSQPHVKRFLGVKTPVMQEAAEIQSLLNSTDLREAWRAEVCEEKQDEPPLVFLLGYPRSGTTLLEQVVESHSEIHSYEETMAFNQALQKVFGGPLLAGEKPWSRFDQCDPTNRCLARRWYFEHLRRLGSPSSPSMILLDKNPALTGHVHLISRLFPDAKFLFMVRDPRDVCLSAFQTQVTITPFSVNWLDWPETVQHCAGILGHWVALRDRLPNPYLEVRYEDLVADLAQTGRQVMSFLGLDWEDSQENFADHARSKQVYSPTIYDVRQGLNQNARGKWKRFSLDYSAGGAPFAALLEQLGYDPE